MVGEEAHVSYSGLLWDCTLSGLGWEDDHRLTLEGGEDDRRLTLELAAEVDPISRTLDEEVDSVAGCACPSSLR